MTPQTSFSRIAILVAALVSVLVASSSAAAQPPCADAILADWLDNSRVDRVYALDCYEAAIDAIPDDLRDYTDAADVIARAFQDRSGRRLEARGLEGPVPTTPGVVPPVDASSSSSVPVPILVLGAMSLTLLGAGGFGYVARRRRERTQADDRIG